MSKVHCPACDRLIAMHEIETRTTTRSHGFATTYRCPFCRFAFEDVADNIV